MKVTVDYLFSKNKKIGSRFISWGTKHLSKTAVTPSHVATLINERWVFESTLDSGIRVINYKKWLDLNEEVAKIPCTRRVREYSEIKAIYQSVRDKKYDWLGVTYFGCRLFLNKYFGCSMPEVNKWESADKYFCSEAVGIITGQGKYSMKAPVQLLDEFTNGIAV